MKYNIGFNITYGLVSVAFHLWFNIKVEGKENIPADESFIVASNHRTYADPPLVNVCIKRRFCFIAKRPLFKNPLFGWLISHLGAVPSTSDDPNYDIISIAADALDNQKKCLCIFPEGTRHKDGVVGRGHSGVVVMAAKTGKKILPVGITFGKKLHFRSKIVFKIGTPVDVKDYGCNADSSTKELKAPRDEVMRQIKTMAEDKKCLE